VAPDAYRAAEPDPLRREETDLVADLRDHHPEFVARLVTCVAAEVPRPLPDPRKVLRIDRYGIVLGTGGSRSYLRVVLPRPVRDATDFALALHPLFCDRCYGDPDEMARYGLLLCP